MKMAKKIILVFFVLNGVGISVSLMLAAGLGSDSIGLLCDGIHSFFQLPYGNASLVYNLLAIAIAFFVARKDLALGSIAYALIGGYFIEFYFWLLSFLSISDLNILLRFGLSAIGVVLLSLSLAILIQQKLGMNALDAIVIATSKKTKISYRILRTGTDISYALIGTLLGGVFGIGTIVSMLCTGYLIDYFSRKLSRPESSEEEIVI